MDMKKLLILGLIIAAIAAILGFVARETDVRERLAS